jgi:hypothetical protein
MKHSPSPWRKFEHSWHSTSIADSNGNIICSLSIYDEATEENQQELETQMDANANLIKAAPELLENLNVILECLRLGYNANECVNEIENAIAVIAKATNQKNQ